jgi:hypothetical protein
VNPASKRSATPVNAVRSVLPRRFSQELGNPLSFHPIRVLARGATVGWSLSIEEFLRGWVFR